MSTLRCFALLLLSASAGCYQAHGRSDHAVDAGVRSDAASDAGRLCGCIGSPTRRACVLPLMCCPATETCEDPARFNCSSRPRPPCE